jgi:quercetin dioxygenase-like cupin family protein
MISGEMIVRIGDGSGNLIERIVGPGDVMHFSPGLVHQTEAITDVVYIEASTPHFNDRVRVESDYGLQLEEGLPSTSLEEVIEK